MVRFFSFYPSIFPVLRCSSGPLKSSLFHMDCSFFPLPSAPVHPPALQSLSTMALRKRITIPDWTKRAEWLRFFRSVSVTLQKSLSVTG